MADATAGPETKEAFFALPAGPTPGRNVGAYFMGEETIVRAIDSDGDGWRLGRYLDGEWFRERAL